MNTAFEGTEKKTVRKEYLGKKYYRESRGYYRDRNGRYLHRHVYQKDIGAIPKGWMVSFKDGDKEHIEASNLELVKKDVARIHLGGERKCLPWVRLRKRDNRYEGRVHVNGQQVKSFSGFCELEVFKKVLKERIRCGLGVDRVPAWAQTRVARLEAAQVSDD